MVDPNTIVSSSGISRLKDVGIDVTVGVEEELCKKMNEGFIHRMLTGKPLLALRYSISVNGCFLDKIGEGARDIGGYYSKLLQEYDGMIFSSSLSDKLSSISSQEATNVLIQPIQIIVGSNARQSLILASSNTVEESCRNVVLITKKELVAESGISSNSAVETLVLENINLGSILEYCSRRGLFSVLLDLRGNNDELEVLLRDRFEQKEIIEVLPEWTTKDERQIAPMNFLESISVKDLYYILSNYVEAFC